jgi:NAD-dependent dihydropyrimidine dehydrogenase PreA subunit
VDKHTFSTSLPGVFACGNIIREQKMAVHSAAQGKMAAQQVARYLGTQIADLVHSQNNASLQQHSGLAIAESHGRWEHRHKSISAIGHLFEPEWKEYLQEGIQDHRVEPAGGNQKGFLREEAMHEAQRCMHCDCRKPVSCKLRMYAETYEANRKRFAGPTRNLLSKSMQHELVVYETEKCIRCGLCVDVTKKHGEAIGLAFAGRGFDVRISVPFNETIKEAISITARECVESCPTGALAYKAQEERNSL